VEGAALVEARMIQRPHQCRVCGVHGHNRRSCPEVRRTGAAAQVFEVPGADAKRVLVKLRPIVSAAAKERRPIDSIMLSCYLAGMLDASVRLEPAS
jgi:hypothetical protein